MQVVLLDKKKLTKLTLPNVVEGAYLMEYKPVELPTKKTVSIEAQNNKWHFISNGEINAVDKGVETPSMPLANHDYFQLKISNVTGNFLLFVMPTNSNDCHKLNTDIDSITIGSDSENTILYTNEFIQPHHATIYKENERWYLSAPEEDATVYLNDVSITKNELKMGDIIFIYGLKILWLHNHIFVYNVEDKVKINNVGLSPYVESKIDNSKFTPITDDAASLELYGVNDYFFPPLRIKSKEIEKSIKIDDPPQKPDDNASPMWLQMGGRLMMIASSFMMVSMVWNGVREQGRPITDFIPQLIMIGAMLVGMLLWPQIVSVYQKRQAKKKEAIRQKKYLEYIEKMKQEIEMSLVEEEKILRENNPLLKEVSGIAFAPNSLTRWSRKIIDEDFLRIRLGEGTVPAKLKIDQVSDSFALDKDDLKELQIEVANKEYALEKSAVEFSLIENRINALICDREFEQSYIDALILQLTTFHSAAAVKLVFLLDDPNINQWEYVKYMPHTLGGHKDVRFFANGAKEIKALCSYLDAEYNYRKEIIGEQSADFSRSFAPYYIIITNDYYAIKNNSFISNIVESPFNLGYSLLIVEQSFRKIPAQCNVFLQVMEQNAYVLYKDSGEQIKFVPEYDPDINMRNVAISLSSIPLLPPGSAASLPTTLTFLDMFNVSKLEQLNIQNRWKMNNPVTSLQAEIGVQTDGQPFYLDLHEKFHGPHGLVAGTTGSGKSEFLITYLLSLAINYHPYEVQFVIIDYKGGGLAGAFENRSTGAKIPHLVGTITNLDASEMNRTLVSITSEVKRRQQIFNAARDKLGEGTIDIYKYQQFYRERKVDEPMSHLMIVSDEFAELKSQQPDFMDELISIARIGRSLGVHLILATQKPSGVVTDQIWSNSKFKVCLKVQDKSDSMDMLKRPEAASLKEAGRFYLQIGYDEFFDIGQSGWAGAAYNPTNTIVKKVDDAINFIDNTGYVYKTINNPEDKSMSKEKDDQLTSTVKHLIDVATKEGCQVEQLWKTSIPAEIFISELQKKYEYEREPFKINPIIGEYDNPSSQFQGLLTIDITNNGNTLIYGQAGSGKENLLSTIIYSVCINHHPSEANIYIVDFGVEMLKMFGGMPHVGDICTIDEEEKFLDLINMISKEMARRKQLFADYNGNYQNYLKNSGKTLPSMIVIINNYEAVDENFKNQLDILATIFRDANKFGIYFIVTTSTENTMRVRTASTFQNKLCLQMPGDETYRNLLGAPRSLRPLNIFGRGIVKLDYGQFEFQTAYICDPDEISNHISKTIEIFKQYNYKAKPVPVLPDSVTLNHVEESMTGLHNVPVGINIETKEITTYDFTRNKINIIAASDMEDNANFLHALTKLLTRDTQINLRIIDILKILDQNKVGVNVLQDQFDQVISAIHKEVTNEAALTKNHLYVFVGIGELKAKLNEDVTKQLDEIFAKVPDNQKTYFILADTSNGFKNIQSEKWASTIDKKSGIWLGSGASEQMTISFTNLSMEDRTKTDPKYAWIATKGSKTITKKIVLEEEKNE